MEQGETPDNETQAPDDAHIDQDGIVVAVYPPPEYQDAIPQNIVSTHKTPAQSDHIVDISTEETQSPPDFDEAMRPENQSRKVKGVALLLLPFYILFYEIPVWIWTVMLPFGKE
ncbi:hypothetical protein HDV06_000343 [Boothiomyces sp. JEL0866]|nr:hypothetical protein HDV06_000343 [Boothiomyces sp. JEL0866]